MDIAGYLKFYLGCDIKQDISSRCGSSRLTVQLLSYVYENNLFNEVKLILRPLSDMTDEEAVYISKEVLFEHYWCFKPVVKKVANKRIEVWDQGNSDGDQVHILFHGEIIRKVDERWEDAPFESSLILIPYLLSRYFDLFGLIEAGLAIDKTKQHVS